MTINQHPLFREHATIPSVKTVLAELSHQSAGALTTKVHTTLLHLEARAVVRTLTHLEAMKDWTARMNAAPTPAAEQWLCKEDNLPLANWMKLSREEQEVLSRCLRTHPDAEVTLGLETGQLKGSHLVRYIRAYRHQTQKADK